MGLRVLTVLLAATAVFFVIRTGHLGAKLAWGREGEGGPPAGFQGGPAGRGSAARRRPASRWWVAPGRAQEGVMVAVRQPRLTAGIEGGGLGPRCSL